MYELGKRGILLSHGTWKWNFGKWFFKGYIITNLAKISLALRGHQENLSGKFSPL